MCRGNDDVIVSSVSCIERLSVSYYCRFPYPLQPDIQLITSLQRLGWEVDSSKNEVRHLNQWYVDLLSVIHLSFMIALKYIGNHWKR